MADTLDIVTLAEARSAVNINTAGYVADDTRLAAFVTAISRHFDNLVGPVVQRTVTAEVQDGGRNFITLDLAPISAVTSITEYSGTAATVLASASNTSQPSNGYLLDPWRDGFYKGRIYRRSGNTNASFPDGRGNVVITYTAGRYANTAAVDQRFKTATELTLANVFRREQRPVNPGFGGPEAMNDVVATAFPGYLVPNAALAYLVDDIIGSVA
jgi:hypothetical protein